MEVTAPARPALISASAVRARSERAVALEADEAVNPFSC